MNRLLAPFSLLYGIILALRNYAFDYGFLKSKSFDIPVISVGNLSVGGTGKSPMIEYLIELLSEEYVVGVVSRGYGRQTKEMIQVSAEHSAQDVGDEPLQFKRKFPELYVVVCADRVKAIESLKECCEVVLLDDAFQHRYVNPAINILLTTYEGSYHLDWILPLGRLREWRNGARRADIVVTTKCPRKLDHTLVQRRQYELQLKENQIHYASTIDYEKYCISAKEQKPIKSFLTMPFTLVTGIANSDAMVQELEMQRANFKHFAYSDHHNFTSLELKKISQEKLILTTEKDYQRLGQSLDKNDIYYWPIKMKFLHQTQEAFDCEILRRVAKHRTLFS